MSNRDKFIVEEPEAETEDVPLSYREQTIKEIESIEDQYKQIGGATEEKDQQFEKLLQECKQLYSEFIKLSEQKKNTDSVKKKIKDVMSELDNLVYTMEGTEDLGEPDPVVIGDLYFPPLSRQLFHSFKIDDFDL